MERIAFRMKIFKGQADEYQRRHDSIWPGLQDLLKQNGIHRYSIFLDEQTEELFGTLELEEPDTLDKLREEPLMRKWWDYMQDIMETNADHSPLSRPLKEVFYLP